MYAFLYATDPQLTASEVSSRFSSRRALSVPWTALTTTGILAACSPFAAENRSLLIYFALLRFSMGNV